MSDLPPAALILAGGGARRLDGIDKTLARARRHFIAMHHLVALWPIAARDALYRFLNEPGPRGVQAFPAGLAMWRVDFPAVAWDPFHNVNTQDDLTAARVLATRREVRWKP